MPYYPDRPSYARVDVHAELRTYVRSMNFFLRRDQYRNPDETTQAPFATLEDEQADALILHL